MCKLGLNEVPYCTKLNVLHLKQPFKRHLMRGHLISAKFMDIKFEIFAKMLLNLTLLCISYSAHFSDFLSFHIQNRF